MSQNNGPLTEGVFYILISLYEPRHGYGIMQYTTELSNGRVNLAPGTLYGAINSLLDKGWIKGVTEEKSSRKKTYQITPLGKAIVNEEIKRLEEMLSNAKDIVENYC